MSPTWPPRDEDDLRRLLASDQGTDPMPADVAARLDETITRLAAERTVADEAEPAAVVPLRRRRRTGALLAAAAVVVVAAGAATVVLQQRTSDTSMVTADSAVGTAPTTPLAESSSSGGKVAPSPTSGDSGAATKSPEHTTDTAGRSVADAEELLATNYARLSSDDFESEATGLVGQLTAEQAAETTKGTAAGSEPPAPATSSEAAACPGPTASPSPGTVTMAVVLDGKPAVLWVSPLEKAADQRIVIAWSCDGATELARTIVTVP